MNEYDRFFRHFYNATQTQKRRRIIVKIKGLLVDGLKSFPGKQTADPGLLSPFRMDGWMIEIKGFKLLTKGRDICSILNVKQNMIPDGRSVVTKSLASKTFGQGAEKLEGILREGAGTGSLKSKMLT